MAAVRLTRWTSPPESVRALAVEREVAEADLLEAVEARTHLLQQHARHGAQRRRRLHGAEKGARAPDVEPEGLGQALAAQLPGTAVGVQALPLAVGARGVAAVAREVDAHADAVALALAPLEVALDAVPTIAAVQDRVLRVRRQIAPRHVGGHAFLAAPGEHPTPGLTGGADLQGPHGAILERQAHVRDDELPVVAGHAAEAAAGRAGADGAVEAEQVGRGRPVAGVAGRAVQPLAEGQVPGRGVRAGEHPGHGLAPTGPECRLEGVEEAGARDAAGHDAVHDHPGAARIGEVGAVRGDVHGAVVGEDARQAGGAQLGGSVGGLPARPQGQVEAEDHLGTAGQGSEGLGGPLRPLTLDHAAAALAVELGRPRPQELQVVQQLAHGGDRGAAAALGLAALDGDGGQDALDAVHLGPVHALEELPGVGREGLDVAALALGVERVERQRGLARAGDPGDDGQGPEGDVRIDAAEVVTSGAADADGLGARGHRRMLTKGKRADASVGGHPQKRFAAVYEPDTAARQKEGRRRGGRQPLPPPGTTMRPAGHESVRNCGFRSKQSKTKRARAAYRAGSRWSKT